MDPLLGWVEENEILKAMCLLWIKFSSFMPCKFSLDILQSNEKNEVTKQAAKNALT